MSKGPCAAEPCERIAFARGLCNAHYLQASSGKALRPIGQQRHKKPRALLPHPSDPSLCLVPMTKGYFAIISVVDREAVSRFSWFAKVCDTTVYAVSKRTGERGFSLHRLIGREMGLSLENTVDHKNGNGLDCRRSNLRDATRIQQRWNTSVRRDSRSGIKGVAWEERTQRWRVKIKIDGREITLGRFDTSSLASEAYEDAARRYFGEFSAVASRGGES